GLDGPVVEGHGVAPGGQPVPGPLHHAARAVAHLGPQVAPFVQGGHRLLVENGAGLELDPELRERADVLLEAKALPGSGSGWILGEDEYPERTARPGRVGQAPNVAEASGPLGEPDQLSTGSPD